MEERHRSEQEAALERQRSEIEELMLNLSRKEHILEQERKLREDGENRKKTLEQDVDHNKNSLVEQQEQFDASLSALNKELQHAHSQIESLNEEKLTLKEEVDRVGTNYEMAKNRLVETGEAWRKERAELEREKEELKVCWEGLPSECCVYVRMLCLCHQRDHRCWRRIFQEV